MSRRKQAKPRAFLKLGEDPDKCSNLELLEPNAKKHEGNRTANLEKQMKSEFTETPKQQCDQKLNSASAIKLKIKVSHETSAVYAKYEQSTSNNIVKNTKNTKLDNPTIKMDNDCVSNISTEGILESDNEDIVYLNDEEYTEDDLHSLDSFYSGKLNVKI
ncbi:uncharacterized protein LOC120770710 [Bactrocera tryoni]|uniref:uncharacterized protein LOC120770710 n=1 Tax=Bactrocera tryoni TaxID=59916 RepID=UPI001A97C4BA|nr:uncharacterized protein LOC120770710 [Bactrocera tryoni]